MATYGSPGRPRCAQAPEVIRSRSSRTSSRSSRSLITAPRVSATAVGARGPRRRRRPGCCTQSMVSATPGGLARSISRSRWTAATTDRASASETPGARTRTIASSRSALGKPDPVVEAATLEGVVQLAGAVGGQDHQRRLLGPDRADLGDRDLEVGEQLEQERLELVVGAVDLVDEQDRPVAGVQRRPAAGARRRNRGPNSASTESSSDELLLGQGPDLEHLPGVVPLVERLLGVDALVALQPDQPAVEHLGQGLGHLGLADADLTLEQDRPVQRRARRGAWSPGRGRRDSRRRRSASVSAGTDSGPPRRGVIRGRRARPGPGRGGCPR